MKDSGGSVLEIFQILKLVVCGLKISNILDVTFLIDSTIFLNKKTNSVFKVEIPRKGEGKAEYFGCKHNTYAHNKLIPIDL